MSARTEVIADLRASIEGIERRVGREDAVAAAGTAVDGVPRIGPGTLTEVFADGTRDAGAVFGFSLSMARGLVTPERPVVIFLQMRGEAQETGLPYGPGLLRFGFDPDALAIVRTDTVTELLWAMEEAAGCRTVAAVIAEVARHHKQLDFTASRRLSMRAARFGTALMVLRTGMEREASAAGFRFHVAALTSAEAPFDMKAPGAMRARLTLEKGTRRLADRGGTRQQDAFGRDFWDVRWTEDGLVADRAFPGEMGTGAPVRERDENANGPFDDRRSRSGGKPALSGADAARLGDRLSQTA